jgi:hypothetical protein
MKTKQKQFYSCNENVYKKYNKIHLTWWWFYFSGKTFPSMGQNVTVHYTGKTNNLLINKCIIFIKLHFFFCFQFEVIIMTIKEMKIISKLMWNEHTVSCSYTQHSYSNTRSFIWRLLGWCRLHFANFSTRMDG